MEIRSRWRKPAPVSLQELDDNDGTDSGDPISITTTVTGVSDILVLTTSDAEYTNDAKLVIDLGLWSDVNDYLPQNEISFKGTHMINYDLSSLSAESITLVIGTDEKITIISETDYASDGSDTVILTDSDFDLGDTTNPYAALYDADTGDIKEFDGAEASLEIGLKDGDDDADTATATAIPAGTAIVLDIFAFGLDGGSYDARGKLH